MLQFSRVYFVFVFVFPFTEKQRKSHYPQPCSSRQPGGSGVKGGAMGVKPTEFILPKRCRGLRVPVGPLVLLTVYAITRF